MEHGIRERLVADPRRTGVTTGNSRSLAGNTYYQGFFTDSIDHHHNIHTHRQKEKPGPGLEISKLCPEFN